MSALRPRWALAQQALRAVRAGRRALSSTPQLQHGISNTARLTAYLRALETEKGRGGLIFDPYAHLLAGSDAQTLLQDFESRLEANRFLDLETMQKLLRSCVIIRHRFFDDFVLKALDEFHEGPHESQHKSYQCVNMASGLDTRALRMPWPAHTACFEIDRAEVLDYKRSVLAKTGSKPLCATHVTIPADIVTDDWEHCLLDHGFDPTQPTVWVAEGLLNYLSEEEAGRLLRRMRNMSAAGSYVGADSLSHTTLSSPLMEGIRGQLQSMDAPLRFGTNAPEAFLKAAGWEEPEVASLGDPDRAHYDRWPLSPYLQYLPAFLCPKGFLMTAKATSDGLG